MRLKLMQTKRRGESLFDMRNAGVQRIPYENTYGLGRVFGNRETYDSALSDQNPIKLYDDFKLSLSIM